MDDELPLSYRASAALKVYLGQQVWDSFYTVTFKSNQRFPFTAISKVSKVLRTYGHVGRAFIAAEQHMLGGYHCHGLVAWRPLFDGSPTDYALQMAVTKSHFDRLGWSNMQVPRDIGGVTGYCAKYLTKNTVEWDFLGQEWHS